MAFGGDTVETPEFSSLKKKILYGYSTIILSFHAYFTGCFHCRTLLGYLHSEMCIVRLLGF